MSREARIIPSQGYLHVICRANNHKRILSARRDCKAYYRLARKIKIEEGIKIFHYCIMFTHVHFLVGVDELSNLARFIKRLNLKYFHYYINRKSYSGHLWHGRFKSYPIEDDQYFLRCGKYIEMNPVRAGIVDSPEEYEFSSYQHYACGKEDRLVDEDLFYHSLGETDSVRQEAYRKMIIEEDLEKGVIL